MDLSKLDSKYAKYVGFVRQVQDRYGFIEHDECDSLLFTALFGTIPEARVYIYAARSDSGAWYRRPLDYKSCYTPSKYKTAAQVVAAMGKSIWSKKRIDKKEITKILAGSGSTISRDMLLGLAWYCYLKKTKDIAEGVINYALDNNMIMGKGDPSRIIISPGLLSTFAWVSYRLGGESRSDLRKIPQGVEGQNLTGYQAHLEVLHTLLRGYLEENIGPKERDLLDHHARRQPRNALFRFAAGDTEAASAYLAEEAYWPMHRLPTSLDRKEPWLFQRDFGPSWEPASGPERVHSGGDFLFLYNLIKNHPIP